MSADRLEQNLQDRPNYVVRTASVLQYTSHGTLPFTAGVSRQTEVSSSPVAGPKKKLKQLRLTFTKPFTVAAQSEADDVVSDQTVESCALGEY